MARIGLRCRPQGYPTQKGADFCRTPTEGGLEEMPELRERLDQSRGDLPAQELTREPTVDGGQGIGNWTQFERRVRRLQERTFRASREGKWRKVKHLQRLLALSWSAKVLAIRDVTERSSGRFTPGIDGKVYLTADAREQLCHEKFNYRTHQPSPAKRGYGPHVLEADIANCFDRIAHDPLLARLHLFRDVVRRWLKAGVVEFKHYEATESGTPQGGVISPLLANIALDGIEELFAGKWWARVVRYADDLVVVAATSRIIERTIRPAVERFLAERGVELNPQIGR